MTNSELNKKAAIAGIFFVLMQLLVRGISFIMTPVYTSLVSQAQYGEIRVYESWLLILVPVLSLSLYRSVERAKYDFEDKYEEYVSSVQALSFIVIAACFAFITIFVRNPFMEFCEIDLIMYIFMILYTFAYTAILFFQRREKQLLRYKNSVIVTATMMVPATVFSVILLYWGNLNGQQANLVDLRVIGYYTPIAIVGVIVALVMWKQGGFKVKTKYWKYAIIFSAPLIPETISIQIMNQADKIMIQKMVTDTAVGIFSLATTVSFIIWILEDAVWFAFLPWLYEKLSRKEYGDIKKPWYFLSYGFGYLSWLLVALAPEIILILGGAKYHDAIYLVAPMVTGTLFRFFSYCFTGMENFQKKTGYTALGTLIAMVINVTLNAICIHFIGYQAAAYTTAVSYFILLWVQGIFEKKVSGMRIVSLGRMLILSLIFFGINVATIGLYNIPFYFRWIVVVVVTLVVAWKMMPGAKKLLKQLRKKKA